MRPSRAGVLCLLAVLLVGAPACTPDEGDSSSPDEPPRVGALTSANAIGGGGASLRQPKSAPDRWMGTFGDLLCTTTAHPLEVVSVDYTAPVEPQSLEFLLHAGEMGSATPVASKHGGPKGLDGEVVAAVGSSLRVPCHDEDSFQELLLVMAAGRGGAVVNQVTIGYRQDGEEFTKVIDWTYAMCGPEVDIPQC